MTDHSDTEARLRALADQEPQPRTSDAVLHGILARRAAGERVTLPAAPPRRFPVWLLAGAAAAVLATLVVSRAGREPRQAAAPQTATPDTMLQVTEMGGFFLPEPLLAQATAEPRYERVPASGGERLRPGQWFYTSPMRDRPYLPSDTAYGVAIERSTWDGHPAWLTLGGRLLPSGKVVWGQDSLWLTSDSLRPLREVKRIGENGRVEKTYRENEVLIGETVNGYTSWRNRPIVDPNRNPAEGVPDHWYQFVATIQSGGLSLGWRRSLEMPFVVRHGPGWGYFLDMEVVRAETVTVPAGRFECWKVVLGREDQGSALWVDKESGWIVARSSFWDGRERYRQDLVRGEDY